LPVMVFAYTCHQNVGMHLNPKMAKLTHADVLNLE